jgi:aminoglycoside 3-N-acetyltransferase
MPIDKAVFWYGNRRYYPSDIINAIQETGIKNNDIVFVHSDLSKFGRLADVKNITEFNQHFLNACLNVVGNNGTLIVPTFTYSFCKGEIFDYYNSPSTLNYFTEVARTADGFIRSEEPIFSVSSKGPHTTKMIDNLSTCCLGKGSIFERLHNINANLLMLGFYLGPTFLHYIEECYKVQYLYDKIFSGIIKKGDNQYEKSYTYNVRNLDINPQLSLEKLKRTAIESGIVTRINLGCGSIMRVRCKDLFNFIGEMLTKDPYSLVTIPKQ